MARRQSQRLDWSGSQTGASGSRSSEKRDMSALRRYEILLPRRFNDGTAVPDELLADTATELREKFGAMSWETQIIRGEWEHEGVVFRDELLRVVIDAPRTAEA